MVATIVLRKDWNRLDVMRQRALIKAVAARNINIKNPGSRGGHFWIDKYGVVQYGERPKGQVKQPETAEPGVEKEKPVKPFKTAAAAAAHNVKEKAKDNGDEVTRQKIQKHILSFAKAFDETYDALLDIAGDIGIVSGRLKTVSSVKGKIERYQAKGKSLEEMQDIAGMRVMYKNVKQVRQAVEQIKKKWAGKILEEDNYIDQPKAGYRSHHFIVESSDGKPIEVQIRTEAQNAWANWAHDTVYEGKAKQKVPEAVQRYAADLSQALWDYDNGRELRLPEAPPEAHEMGVVFKWEGEQ